jgi:hypothetical protein
MLAIISKPMSPPRPGARSLPRTPRPSSSRSSRGARRALAAIVADLVDVHERLVALRAALPDAAEEAGEEGAPRDPHAELVGTIECVVHDDLEPAIRSLRLAAELAVDLRTA